MKLKELHIENFGALDSLTHDFSAASHWSLFGSNGKGKTTVRNAVWFALTGYGFDLSPSVDHYVRDTSKAAVVRATFDLGGGIERVVERKIQKSGKTARVDGVLVNSEDVYKTLGIPANHHLLAAIFMGYFTKLDVKNQRALIADLLPRIDAVEIYEKTLGRKMTYFQTSAQKVYDVITVERLAYEQRLTEVRGKIEGIKQVTPPASPVDFDTISRLERHVAEAREDLDSADRELTVVRAHEIHRRKEEACAAARHARGDAEAKVGVLKEAHAKAEKVFNYARARIQVAEATGRHREAIESLNSMVSRHGALRDQLATARGQYGEVNRSTQELGERIKIAESAACPTCKRPFEGKTSTSQEQLGAWKAQYDLGLQEVSRLATSGKDLADQVSLLDARIQGVREHLGVLRSDVDTCEKRLAECTAVLGEEGARVTDGVSLESIRVLHDTTGAEYQNAKWTLGHSVGRYEELAREVLESKQALLPLPDGTQGISPEVIEASRAKRAEELQEVTNELQVLRAQVDLAKKAEAQRSSGLLQLTSEASQYEETLKRLREDADFFHPVSGTFQKKLNELIAAFRLPEGLEIQLEEKLKNGTTKECFIMKYRGVEHAYLSAGTQILLNHKLANLLDEKVGLGMRFVTDVSLLTSPILNSDLQMFMEEALAGELEISAIAAAD